MELRVKGKVTKEITEKQEKPENNKNIDELNSRLREHLEKPATQIDFEKALNLVKGGANANTVNSYGNTLLHKAAAQGKTRIVTELVNIHKAELNSKNNENLTPLELATQIIDNHEIVDF